MISVIVTSSPNEREHLRSMCAPTRALSRIVPSLTKPNDKIEPTKNDNIKKIIPQLYNTTRENLPQSFILWVFWGRGAHSVMVIVAGYGHGDMSSNPGPD